MGWNDALSRRRSRVRISSLPPLNRLILQGSLIGQASLFLFKRMIQGSQRASKQMKGIAVNSWADSGHRVAYGVPGIPGIPISHFGAGFVNFNNALVNQKSVRSILNRWAYRGFIRSLLPIYGFRYAYILHHLLGACAISDIYGTQIRLRRTLSDLVKGQNAWKPFQVWIRFFFEGL
jgi:hypothetical protein